MYNYNFQILISKITTKQSILKANLEKSFLILYAASVLRQVIKMTTIRQAKDQIQATSSYQKEINKDQYRSGSKSNKPILLLNAN